MFNEQLASKILETLSEMFPKKAQISELQMSLDEFLNVSPRDWMTVIDALYKSGYIRGIPLRGFQDELDAMANLEITGAGQERLRENHARTAGGVMTVRELASRIQKFHDDLQNHFELWKDSLQQPLPRYPVSNIEELRQQSNSLARQLGTLRPYIERLVDTTMMGVPGRSWDAYSSAVGNDVAIVKGSSIDAVLPQLQQILGQLDAMDSESDFSLKPDRQHQTPQTVNVYNLHGAQSRVNVHSTDKSVNVSTISEQQVFSGIRQAITDHVPDDSEKKLILEKLDVLEKSVHSTDFLSRYQAFINAVANHMTIIAPFIPALTQMLKHL